MTNAMVNRGQQEASVIFSDINIYYASISDERALKVVSSGGSCEVEIKDGNYQELICDGKLYLRILTSRVTIAEDLLYFTFTKLSQN